MSATPCFVGIDVAKAQLDIALRPTANVGPWPTMTWGLLPWWSDSRRCRHLDCPRSHGWLPAGRGGGAGRRRTSVAVVNPRQARDLPKRPDNWPRRMPLTRGPWPILPRPCGRPPGLCLMPKPPNSALSWHGGGKLVAMRTAEQNRLGECPPTAADRHPSAYHLARYPAGGAGRRPGHDAADESDMAGARGVAPQRPRHWPSLYTHAAARPARVGHVEPPAPSRLGRGGPVEPG